MEQRYSESGWEAAQAMIAAKVGAAEHEVPADSEGPRRQLRDASARQCGSWALGQSGTSTAPTRAGLLRESCTVRRGATGYYYY